ncbi:hypothetical protein VUJ46_12095 [Chryseobacterium sp. MYb264]|uniref:hypothetical protein n=1 Tax=Chryseobacterium sp. MYb264 TaxID=2745153 RepID=UPI002E10AE1A|nr:hypothetical protein VUJ46_12095 [Chryseobacterium sp. MYb264]
MIKKIKELPFSSYHPSYEFLAFYRIFFSLFLLWMGVSDASWINNIPNSAMHPPISMLSFADTIPPVAFFFFTKYLMYGCLLFILIGLRPRLFAVLYMLTYIITSNYAYSFGKINHDFIYTLPILIMSFSPWNCSYSFFKEPKTENDILSKSWPVFLVSMIFSFGMFTAGFAKIKGGWLNPDLQYTQIFLYQYRYGIGWNALLSDYFVKITSKIFWEFLDYFTVIFETLFIIAFIRPKFFRIMLLLALFFHLNVLFMLNISFVYSIGLYSLFIPTALLSEKLKKTVKNALQKIFSLQYKNIALGIVMVLISVFIIFNINIISFTINKFFSLFTFSTYATSIIILGGAFIAGLILFIKSFKKPALNRK